MNKMGDTIEDMDMDIEQKDNRKELLGNKTRLPDCKDKEEVNKIGLNKKYSKRKGVRIMV